MPNFALETSALCQAGQPYPFVAGIDEVGMGALAGPIVAAAVVLAHLRVEPWLAGVDDSKKLSPKRREQLYGVIMLRAVAIGIGWATNEEIDREGLVNAHSRALVMAFEECRGELWSERMRQGYTPTKAEVVSIVDGENLGFLRGELGGDASLFCDKADSKSYSVAAASIVAKVTRDLYMSGEIPKGTHRGFSWGSHKGYGTARHMEELKLYGPTSLHRLSFKPCKKAKINQISPSFIN